MVRAFVILRGGNSARGSEKVGVQEAHGAANWISEASVADQFVHVANYYEAIAAPNEHPLPAGGFFHDEIFATPNFAGRAADLVAIEASLWGGGGTATIAKRHTIAGLGGVGKSTLAREYAHRAATANRYRFAWWLAAETEDGVMQGLADLGGRLDPRVAEIAAQSLPEAARLTLALIEAGDKSDPRPGLLVYDNVPGPEYPPPAEGQPATKLQDLMPASGAHVIASTRHTTWPGRFAAREIDVLAPEAAVDFLLAETKRSDHDGAAALAKALGYLPLALDHAAATCKARGLSFAAYEREWEAQLADVPEGTDYPRSVAATFGLALDAVTAAAPMAGAVMGLLAYLAPEDIPLDLFPEEKAKELDLEAALDALARVALIRRDKLADGTSGLSVNLVVQAMARARLERLPNGDSAREAVGAALELVTAAFPGGERRADHIRNWPACARLAPHAEAVTGHLWRLSGANPESLGASARSAGVLLSQLALYFFSRAAYATAEPLYHRALAIFEATSGSEHPTIAIALNNLASLLQATGRFTEAEPLMWRAQKIDEKAFGPDHPTVAIRLNNLASLLQATGRLEGAEPLMRRAVGIVEARLGREHTNVATALNNLAQLLQATGRLDEAEPLMRRALAIDEKAYGPDHPVVTRDLNNLAQLLKATGRLDEAEEPMRRALEIARARLGEDHPNTRTFSRNYALLLAKMAAPAATDRDDGPPAG
ncbi:MAG: tetratricopeptide repeat protein [Rhizobiales bacterium]|nr:tetratricopeptide repeat protein [Hyphomicrobiales bacterium]